VSNDWSQAFFIRIGMGQKMGRDGAGPSLLLGEAVIEE